MELIVSAIMSDLLNRALSKAIQRYRRSKAEETEHKLRRLHRVLLQIDATVEERGGTSPIRPCSVSSRCSGKACTRVTTCSTPLSTGAATM